MTDKKQTRKPKTYSIAPDNIDGAMLVARSNIDGSYIGTINYAQSLEERGIAPQAAPGNEVASIGFCAPEQKWYGWSHRAICGFGIGSRTKKGDCSYVPTDWNSLVEDAIRFWSDEGKHNVLGFRGLDHRGQDCVIISWTYSSDENLIPNKTLHGTIGSANMYPPESWGRGEWTATTLDEAKQMAMDFAEGVS